MKLANRPGGPMQDEHEKGKNGVGVARPGVGVIMRHHAAGGHSVRDCSCSAHTDGALGAGTEQA